MTCNPAPPETFVTEFSPRPEVAFEIRAGDASGLQRALNAARSGDKIILNPGAPYVGHFVLPARDGGGTIYLMSKAYDPNQAIPAPTPPGTRVTSTFQMARLEPAPDSIDPVVATAFGARGFRMVGLDIGLSPHQRVGLYTQLVKLGYNGGLNIHQSASLLSQLPTDICIDRCYIHGDPIHAAQDGIFGDAIRFSLVDSVVDDIHSLGNPESHGIQIVNSPGPFQIVNNSILAASENIIFGGADPTIPGVIPANIVMRGNDLTKRWEWHGRWGVKNLLEIKSGQRIVIEGNRLRFAWPDGQDGTALLFNVTNQNGSAPHNTIEDLSFRRNCVDFAASGVSFMLNGNVGRPTQTLQRVDMHENTFLNISHGQFASKGTTSMIKITANPQTPPFTKLDCISIAGNTLIAGCDRGNLVYFTRGGQQSGTTITAFRFEDNIASYGARGIFGAGYSGTRALRDFCDSYTVRGNLFMGGASTNRRGEYPSGNHHVPFVMPKGGCLPAAFGRESSSNIRSRELE